MTEISFGSGSAGFASLLNIAIVYRALLRKWWLDAKTAKPFRPESPYKSTMLRSL